MDAANRRADAGVLFDQIDAAIKIVAAENDVIEQSGYLIFLIRVCRPGCGRRGKRAAGQGEKKTAGNHPWHLVILDAELSRNVPLLGLPGICIGTSQRSRPKAVSTATKYPVITRI